MSHSGVGTRQEGRGQIPQRSGSGGLQGEGYCSLVSKGAPGGGPSFAKARRGEATRAVAPTLRQEQPGVAEGDTGSPVPTSCMAQADSPACTASLSPLLLRPAAQPSASLSPHCPVLAVTPQTESSSAVIIKFLITEGTVMTCLQS